MLNNLRKYKVISSIFTKKTFNFSTKFQVTNPYTLEPCGEYAYLSEKEAKEMIINSYKAYRNWRDVSLDERIKGCNKMLEYFEKNADVIAKDMTSQMGKPITQSKAELRTMIERTRKIMELAPEGLAEKIIKNDQNGVLKITREPIGVALMITPWNFPLLATINTAITAILAGNAVAIKSSPFTPLVGKHFESAFKEAGLDNLVVDLMVAPETCQELYSMQEIGYVSFTGSLQGGLAVQEELYQKRFIDSILELGGKDATYVAEDADLDKAVTDLMNAAMNNAGQNSIAMERIYVNDALYENFVQKSVEFLMNTYKVGDPMLETTNMGPLCLPDAPDNLSQQIESAVSNGAKIGIGGMACIDEQGKGRFFEPTLVYDCENTMDIMLKESFGPLVGISRCSNEEDAIKLMNDCSYGLTAAVYTQNKDLALKIAPRLHASTVYMNRCDFLDALLPWAGRKNSGRGISLSYLGFHSVTKTKSYNFRFYN